MKSKTKTNPIAPMDRILIHMRIEELIERIQDKVFKTEYANDILYNHRTIQLEDLCAN